MPGINDPRLSRLIGNSPVFAQELSKLKRIASCDSRVLITGETGTGKELFAQAIHYLSCRGSGPYVAVNCGAIPSELVESELFGHVRGAYTSANQSREGLVPQAEGGTLFLDDVDCLPQPAQSKFLRLLQEGEYRPVGSSMVRRCDVRVIAASNQNLLDLSSRGGFRQDLYYRLSVLRLSLPPLRERREDMPVLVLHFIRQFAQSMNRPLLSLSPGALKKLAAHDWPGNVRELQHVIERAVLMAGGPCVQAHDIEIDYAPGSDVQCRTAESFSDAKARIVSRFERGYIEQLLSRSSGNVTHAAKAAQKDRRAFFALMQKYGIDAEEFRTQS